MLKIPLITSARLYEISCVLITNKRIKQKSTNIKSNIYLEGVAFKKKLKRDLEKRNWELLYRSRSSTIIMPPEKPNVAMVCCSKKDGHVQLLGGYSLWHPDASCTVTSTVSQPGVALEATSSSFRLAEREGGERDSLLTIRLRKVKSGHALPQSRVWNREACIRNFRIKPSVLFIFISGKKSHILQKNPTSQPKDKGNARKL